MDPKWKKLGGVALAGALALGVVYVALPGFLQIEPVAEEALPATARTTSAVEEMPLPSLEDDGAPVWTAALDPQPFEALVDFGDDDSAPAPATTEAAPLDCLIEPWEMVELGSAVRGVIERIHVDRADTVEAGQVLVELEADVEKAAVEVARARAGMKGTLLARETSLTLEKKRRERGRELFERDAVSQQLWDELDAEAEIARRELQSAQETQRLASLQLEEAEAVLARRSIRSPFAGVVVERMMSTGERVDEEPVLRLAQIDPLRVEVILPSALFGRLRAGMRATVIPELGTEQVLVAEVERVDPVIDAASGTFGARLVLPNPDRAIPGGLHCQIDFLDEPESP